MIYNCGTAVGISCLFFCYSLEQEETIDKVTTARKIRVKQ